VPGASQDRLLLYGVGLLVCIMNFRSLKSVQTAALSCSAHRLVSYMTVCPSSSMENILNTSTFKLYIFFFLLHSEVHNYQETVLSYIICHILLFKWTDTGNMLRTTCILHTVTVIAFALSFFYSISLFNWYIMNYTRIIIWIKQTIVRICKWFTQSIFNFFEWQNVSASGDHNYSKLIT
jgi:hypothetical protein